MTPKWKMVSLVVMAMIALGAFAAPGASAQPLTCGTVGTCFMTGDQDGGLHEYVSAGGAIKCTEVSFAASTAAGTIEEITMTPTYATEKAGGGNNCTTFGFNTHVITHGCTYTFTTPTSLGGGKVTWDPSRTGVNDSEETEAQLHLVCPTGKAITITPTLAGASVCTQTIEPQTPTTGHIVGENVVGSAPMDVTLRITLEGIHYKGTGSSCGDATTHVDGKLTGNSTVKCFSNAPHTVQVDCTFQGTPPPTTYITGDQDGGKHQFVSAGGTISCTEADFPGFSPSVEGKEPNLSQMTFTPSYPTEKAGGGNNCTAFGFANTHVITHECTYTFTEPSESGVSEVKWSGSQLHLVCPTGKAIEITPTALGASVCTETIEPQTPTTGHIVGENVVGSVPMDVTLRITLEGIHYKGSGSSCGDATTHVDGKLTGNSTVKCFSDAGHSKQVDCTFS